MGHRDFALCKIQVPPPPRGEARQCCWHGNPVYIVELLPELGAGYHWRQLHDYIDEINDFGRVVPALSPVPTRPFHVYPKSVAEPICALPPRAARFARYFILLYNQECFRRNCQYERSQYKFDEK